MIGYSEEHIIPKDCHISAYNQISPVRDKAKFLF